MNRPGIVVRLVAVGLGVAVLSLAAGCRGESREAQHAEAATPAPAPPTPDTTPIEALRTPAGFALGLQEATPAPPAEPTPSPAVPTQPASR
jgi:hypothetical protein